MKFMLLDQIAKVFFEDCNPNRAPYRRLLKLMKVGLIETKRISIEPRDLYVPTQDAVKLLRAEGIPYSMGISKDTDFICFRHDKTLIDLRILFKDLGIKIWVPERVIRSINPTGCTPDALLLNQSYIYAIEYERTEKKLTRYQDIFYRYERGQNYDAVLYISPGRAFISKIKEKYVPSRRFYFITLKELLEGKENATFFSMSDGLPVKQFVNESTQCDLKEAPREFLEHIIRPKANDSWEDRKPFISIPKASEKNGDDYDDF